MPIKIKPDQKELSINANLENFGLFGVRNRGKGPQFSGAARRNTETEQKGPKFSGATRRNHWRTENQ